MTTNPATPDRPASIAVVGATGRMGARLIALIRDDPSLTLGAAVVRPGHARLGQDAGEALGLGATGVRLTPTLDHAVDACVDFSSPAAGLANAESCRARGIPLVVGTTGFEPGQRAILERCAGAIPLLIAPNTSRAVNLLFKLVGEAARALGDAADVEIVERHHRTKKDAPSGTALRLAEEVAAANGHAHDPDRLAHGRRGVTGERPRGQVGVHALRTGDNPGEHTVVFGLLGECLELSHRALNRDGFARGALDAARFLVGKPAGLYTMADLLG